MAASGRNQGGQNIQRGKMDIKDREAIQKNVPLIKDEVDGKRLCDFLKSKNIITLDDQHRIKRQDAREVRTQIILENLFARGPNAYKEFLAALDNANYVYVADVIRSTRVGQSNVYIENDTEAAGEVVASDGQRLDKVEEDMQKIEHRVQRLENNEITVESLQAKIQELTVKDESSQKQIQILEDQLTKKAKEIEQLQKENEGMSVRMLTLEKEKDEIKKKLEDQRETNNRLEEIIESNRKEMEKKLKERDQKLEEMNQKLEKRDQSFKKWMKQMDQKLEQKATESESNDGNIPNNPPNIHFEFHKFG